jgi:hypothetical protein
MAKEQRPAFVWHVLIHDFNTQKIKPYNVLQRREDFIKKLKKQCETRENFADALKRDLQHQYWSRCEYEMILYIENDRVYIEPLIGSFIDGRVDVTDGDMLDWLVFVKKLLNERARYDKENNRIYVKFDIFDQLMIRFDELVEFVWNYRHKYQRIKKEV